MPEGVVRNSMRDFGVKGSIRARPLAIIVALAAKKNPAKGQNLRGNQRIRVKGWNRTSSKTKSSAVEFESRLALELLIVENHPVWGRIETQRSLRDIFVHYQFQVGAMALRRA